MSRNQKNKIQSSLADSFKALGATFASLYKLAPFVVIVGLSLFACFVWMTIKWQPLMTASIIFLVFSISVGIFAATGSFGEAMLALVGGLFTAMSVEWNVTRFVGFSVAWCAFVVAALLIASVKIAAKSEDIFRQAALRLVGSGALLKATEEKLKKISESSTLGKLGPIERAELIRTFVFRNVPVELLLPCLHGVENLAVITKCDNKSVGIFVADFLVTFSPIDPVTAELKVDSLYRTIRDCPVPPGEFFEAFERSRRLLVSREMTPEIFLLALSNCLKLGLNADETYAEMRRTVTV